MVLGVLLLGMTAGAIVAGGWLAGGGSILAAIVLYAFVGSLAILGTSLLSFAVSELRRSRITSSVSGLRPAE
jgi:hypothetical protein